MTTPARARRAARLGAVSAGLALALTGCFGKAEPSPSTTAAPAPSSSTTTAAAPDASGGAYVPASEKGPAQNVPKPVMPEAMKKNDQAGAEAAVRYFWEALYYAELTGDTGPLDETYSEYCEFCQASSHVMKKVHEHGEWSTGDKATIKTLTTEPSETGFISMSIIDRTGSTFYKKDGAVNNEASGGESKSEPWLTETAFENKMGHWIIDEIKLQGGNTK